MCSATELWSVESYLILHILGALQALMPLVFSQPCYLTFFSLEAVRLESDTLFIQNKCSIKSAQESQPGAFIPWLGLEICTISRNSVSDVQELRQGSCCCFADFATSTLSGEAKFQSPSFLLDGATSRLCPEVQNSGRIFLACGNPPAHFLDLHSPLVSCLHPPLLHPCLCPLPCLCMPAGLFHGACSGRAQR